MKETDRNLAKAKSVLPQKKDERLMLLREMNRGFDVVIVLLIVIIVELGLLLAGFP